MTWQWILFWVTLVPCSILTARDPDWEHWALGVVGGLSWPIATAAGISRAEIAGTSPEVMAVAASIVMASLMVCSLFRPALLAWPLMKHDIRDRPGMLLKLWGARIGLILGIFLAVWYSMST